MRIKGTNLAAKMYLSFVKQLTLRKSTRLCDVNYRRRRGDYLSHRLLPKTTYNIACDKSLERSLRTEFIRLIVNIVRPDRQLISEVEIQNGRFKTYTSTITLPIKVSRGANNMKLCCCLVSIDSRIIKVSAAETWNGLPEDITLSLTMHISRKRLKTHLFCQSVAAVASLA